MSETKHTPGPWNLDAPFPEMANRIVDADGFDIVDIGPGPVPHANAAFIVQACNAHDALMGLFAASEKYFETYDGRNSHAALVQAWNDFRAAGRNARAALAKAKGE